MIRIGVDVGGTFTKAVACDAGTFEIVASAIVPTTHSSGVGVAEGVAQALAELARDDRVGTTALVAHSTTQAVNALLEGDTSVVGVVGIGRRPDVNRARRRTRVGEIGLAPGRVLQTRHSFVDATDGLDRADIERAVDELIEHGAEVIGVSEAFGVEDPRAEWLALEIAEERGIPACAGHELSGLYGLEMRTVTAALNASILPTALATARVVEDAVATELPGTPLLVMRGDGGASDISSLRRRPIVTAFSGPAASVAGALHHLAVDDGIVVEVGGTSTNISAIKGGRPVLAYVRVLEHVTCVRSLDVRVAGVAGGSMLRIKNKFGRARVTDVGPRSAHIAGLEYCAFSDPASLEGARVQLISPRPGDPADYVVIETGEGRVALTLTCAANALGRVPQETYANGNAAAARAGFEVLARATGGDWRELAEQVLASAASKVATAVAEVAREHSLASPTIVGVGGGAGALVPAVADALGAEWSIPSNAEVISSVGDALSLVRVEVERGLTDLAPDSVALVHREAEQAAVEAGAAPGTIHTESIALPDRRALRVVAVGSLALESGLPREHHDDEALRVIAKEKLGCDPELVAHTGFYVVFAADGNGERPFVVVDGRGSIADSGRGRVFTGPGFTLAAELPGYLGAMVRRIGPLSVAPPIKIVRGSRLVDLTLLSSLEKLTAAATAECGLAGTDEVAVLVAHR